MSRVVRGAFTCGRILCGTFVCLQIFGSVVRVSVAAVGADLPMTGRWKVRNPLRGTHGAGQSQQQIEPGLFSLLLGASAAGRDLRGLLLVAGTCSAGGF